MVRLMLTVCLLGIMAFGALVALSAKPEPTEAAYTQEQVNDLSRFCRQNGYRVT